MMLSGDGLIMILALINNLFIQQFFQLNVGPIAIKMNGCCGDDGGGVISRGGGYA